MTGKDIAAILSLRVYDEEVINLDNQPRIPVNWVEIDLSLPPTNGFAYGVFRNTSTGEVVISYRGTDGLDGMAGWDGANNAGLWLGSSTSQAVQAAKVYAAVLKAYGTDAAGSNISFTGHSLGGGLAGLMAVFFNRPAIVFDPAPFQSTAENIYAVANIQDSLGESLPAAFSNYSPQHLAAREAQVQSFHAVGEALQGGRNAANTINATDTPVLFGNQHVGAVAMHSQALLTAGLMSEAFRLATVEVQASTPLILSGKFYSPGTKGAQDRNFLIDLIRSEQADPGATSYGKSQEHRI